MAENKRPLKWFGLAIIRLRTRTWIRMPISFHHSILPPKQQHAQWCFRSSSSIPGFLTSMESTQKASRSKEKTSASTLNPPSAQRPHLKKLPQHPSDISTSAGSYICVASDCHSRFDTPAKLVRHPCDSHHASPLEFGGREVVIMTMSATV